MKVTPKKPHFFKPILPTFKNYIKIPIGFLKYLKGQEQEYVVLRRAGKKWLVKLNGHRLEEGWEKFAEEHDLQLGDIVVFRHEGNMEFEVVIFDSSYCDREYTEHLQEEAIKEDEEEKEQEEVTRSKKFEFKDKPNPCIAPSRKAFPNSESAIHSPFGQCYFACIPGTRDFIGKKPSTSGEDGLPHFISTIKPYSINRPVLNFPTDFAKSNGLMNRKCEMILKDEVQRSWSVRLGRSGPNSFGITCGWKEFRIANGLQEGDAYKFELIKNGNMPIAYFRSKGLHFQEQTDLRTKALDVTAPNSQVAASTFTDNDANPHFISTIKPYTISYTVLHLPMAFAKSNDLLSRTEMILVNEKQKKWCVGLGQKGDHFGIIRGWARFMKANGVRVGDTYRFELINNGTIPIAYFHCDLRPLTGGRVIEGSWGINFFYSFVTVMFGPACVGLHSSTMYLLVATSN